jgi:hypothetical protein
MSFLGRLLLGDGTFKPGLRTALEAEGLVLVEEACPGSLRYAHFRAPGRYHHGKITPQRLAVGISASRLVVYCRSGRTKLIDTAFADPRAGMLDASLHDDDTVDLVIDYDQGDVPRVTGQVTIRVHTPSAARIAGELRARLGRPGR